MRKRGGHEVFSFLLSFLLPRIRKVGMEDWGMRLSERADGALEAALGVRCVREGRAVSNSFGEGQAGVCVHMSSPRSAKE
jgi:hypothetical protein